MTSRRQFISKLTHAYELAQIPGVSELVKICSIASAFEAKVFPHGHSIHAALHMVTSQSPEVCPLAEYLILHVAHKMHFQEEPLLTLNGELTLPGNPAFGIELTKAKWRKHR